MTFTLDVRGDTTYVVDENGRADAMVQPDTYHPGRGWWSSWRRTGGPFDVNAGWEWQANHDTREQALAACGWLDPDVEARLRGGR